MRFKLIVWERHSNKWSGWTRIFSVYPLVISTYFHNWYAVIGVIIFVILNPTIFPKPKDTNNWMSKSVIAEKEWLKRGGMKQMDFIQLINIINGLFFFGSLYAAYSSILYTAIILMVVSTSFKLWFLNEMVKRYERWGFYK